MFNRLGAFLEKRRLRESFSRPFVRGHGRDSFRYYENGHWVTLEAELMSGRTGIDRVIYRRCPLKWDDSGEDLTPGEKEKVFRVLTDMLDREKVRWAFSDAI
jgi:hypothetical protein